MNFQTFWGGRRITPFEVLCLRSFTSAGHTVDLYTYDEVPVLPGVTIRNARMVLPQSSYREDSCFEHHPGVFSDHFRYKLLYEGGGWWIDTDVMLVGEVAKTVWSCFAYQDHERVNNAIMKFAPHDPVMRECLEETIRMRDAGPVEWGDTGPNLLTLKLRRHRLLPLAGRPTEYYPISFDTIRDILNPERMRFVKMKLEGATFLHLWNAVLIRDGVDKLAEPPPGSWLREQADRLLGDGEWKIWQAWSAQHA